jgi:hypothetical protein
MIGPSRKNFWEKTGGKRETGRPKFRWFTVLRMI